MLKLILKNVTPPDGFRYIDPDTKRAFRDMNLEDLTKQAVAHRVANKLNVDNYQAVIEDWLCRQMPDGICSGNSPVFTGFAGVHRTAENTVNATLSLYKATQGAPIVSQDEAERRAKICKACDRNVPFSGCSSCRGVKQAVEELLRGRRILKTYGLHACSITGVMNEYVAFSDRDTLLRVMGGRLSQAPPECWAKG